MADAEAPNPAAEQPTEDQLTGEQPTDEQPTVVEPTVAPTPEVLPTPEVVPTPEASKAPQVASTTEVPATPATPAPAPVVPAPFSTGASPSDGEGGEWELLVSKVQGWLASGQLQQQWQAARTPLSLLAGLIALLLVLRIYGALLAVLDSIPLLPGLLELAGLIAVLQFGLTRMVRSSDRRQVIDGVRQRWQSFRGRS